MIKNDTAQPKHSLMMEDRARMSLTGVSEVSAFSDTIVSLKTCRGILTIQGKGMNISKLNTDTGELNVNGDISLIKYSKDKAKGGLFEGLFR